MVIKKWFGFKNIDAKELLFGSLASFVFKSIGILSTYVLFFVVTRTYSPSAVGLYSILTSAMLLLTMISALGTNVAILRFVGQYGVENIHKLRLVYRVSVAVSLLGSSLIAIIFYLFAEGLSRTILGNPDYEPLIRAVVVFLPLMAVLQINIELIRGMKKIRYSEFLRTTVRPIFVMVCILALGDVFESSSFPVYAYCIATAVAFLMSFHGLRAFWVRAQYYAADLWVAGKHVATISLPMMLIAVSVFVSQNAGLYFVEVFRSSDAVGQYALVTKISMLVSTVLLVVNTMSAPMFSELYWKGDHKRLKVLLINASRLIFVGSLLLALFIWYFSDWILNYFGKGYASQRYTLYILLLSQVVNSYVGSVGVFMNMTGNQVYFRKIALSSVFLVLVLNSALVPSYGPLGAALASLGGSLYMNIALAVYIRSQLGFVTYFTLNSRSK